MTRVILDAEMRRRLLGLSQPLELCDEAGNLLGLVTPIPDDDELRSHQPPLSEQELNRRSCEPTMTTAQVLARLEKL